MAIEVTCTACNQTMMVKDSFGGKRGACPKCKASIEVPPLPESAPVSRPAPFVEPTERQIDYAKKLGVPIPAGVSRNQLSSLIDEAKENAPATESQKEYLRDLGIAFPADIRGNQISMLIDAATDIRGQVASGIIPRYEQQLRDAGMLVEHLSDEQLLNALADRGKDFFVFLLENDEFRYQSLPMSGQLRWSSSLNLEDVKYMLIKLAGHWAVDLDLQAYADEFDGKPPSIEFNADVLETQGSVHRLRG